MQPKRCSRSDVLALGLLFALCACSAGDEDAARANCEVVGVTCTWLGQPGQEGFNGDGQQRLETTVYWPMDMLFTADGSPWFIDWNNHLIRRVEPDGSVRTFVGWTDPIFPGDGTRSRAEHTTDGALGLEVQLNHPTDLLEAADGRLIIASWHNHKIRTLDPSNDRVHIMSGADPGFAGDGGPAALALYRQPKAVAAAPDGTLFILDQQNFRIRSITAEGTVSTLAGAGMPGNAGDGGPAVAAQFGFEAGSNPEPSGGLAYLDGRLFVADTLNHRIRVVDVATGLIQPFAGTGVAGDSGDGGAAIEAQLSGPRDLEIGPDGDLYVADTDNHRIRAINIANGTIRTVAGTGAPGFDDEGALATEARLRRPFGLAFDAAGDLYVSDTLNNRIVRIKR